MFFTGTIFFFMDSPTVTLKNHDSIPEGPGFGWGSGAALGPFHFNDFFLCFLFLVLVARRYAAVNSSEHRPIHLDKSCYSQIQRKN